MTAVAQAESQPLVTIFGICHILGMSSSCTSPVLYAFVNKNFQVRGRSRREQVEGRSQAPPPSLGPEAATPPARKLETELVTTPTRITSSAPAEI